MFPSNTSVMISQRNQQFWAAGQLETDNRTKPITIAQLPNLLLIGKKKKNRNLQHQPCTAALHCWPLEIPPLRLVFLEL